MNRRARPRIFIALIACAFFVCGLDDACFAQKTLAWKFTKGRAIQVVVEQETDMKLEGLANLPVKETHATQTTNLTWTVLDTTVDGVSSVDQSISRIVLKMNSAAGNFIVDTADSMPLQGMGETIAKGIRPLAGAHFVVKSRANGEVLDVTIPDDVARKLGDVAGGLGEASLKEIAVNGSLQFPTKPVNVGETWGTQFEIDMRVFGKLIIATNYQYLGEEVVNGQKLDKIKATTATRAADPNDSTGLKLTKQESAGTIWFDNARGCIDHSELQQEIAMDVKQGGVQIKQAVNQKLKLSFKAK